MINHRKIIITLIAVNLLWLVIQMPVLFALRGYTRVILMDHFVELQEKGVINQQALEQHFGDRIDPADSISIRNYFLGDIVNLPGQIAIVTAIILFLNTVCLLCAVRKSNS